MSIYGSLEGIGDHGDPEHLGQPWTYQGSHIPPREDGPRAGSLGLAVIPSHITADGRDDQPCDGPPWPWLRLHLDVPGDDPCVLLDPAQARFLAEQLRTWADRADPPEFEGGQHWWIHDTRGIGWPGSHDRDAVVARLAELREQHPENTYRLVCDTTTSTVEET
ncbi:hypothetical protein PV729_45380 [Streptomyces europaeiscabiei]|uniref:Uncharacterized protein n=3 Tax=Streptomyces europaeiscabiei TaxID=146819 RepID=A0ABU4NXH1_9ACTN|nr:hypothetical protein [Streptomyces europaeiscabiei]MDX3558808.1 hypothetical protein [Streptomyces europaeiscabiei]MDX3707256.1 hypothetical protein [Streptomyces europaeiscabiei]